MEKKKFDEKKDFSNDVGFSRMARTFGQFFPRKCDKVAYRFWGILLQCLRSKTET